VVSNRNLLVKDALVTAEHIGFSKFGWTCRSVYRETWTIFAGTPFLGALAGAVKAAVPLGEKAWEIAESTFRGQFAQSFARELNRRNELGFSAAFLGVDNLHRGAIPKHSFRRKSATKGAPLPTGAGRSQLVQKPHRWGGLLRSGPGKHLPRLAVERLGGPLRRGAGAL